jgi:magnesium-transporting ATPase (P-type)
LGTAFAIQLIMFIDIKKQHWYRFLATNEESEKNQTSMEATILWSIMFYQVLSAAFAFSISKPFKRPLITNFVYVSILMVLAAWVTYVTMIPDWWHIRTLKFVEIPVLYRVRVFGVSMLYFICSFLFERGVIAGVLKPFTAVFSYRKWKMWCSRWVKGKAKSHRGYKNLAASVKRLRSKGRVGVSRKNLYANEAYYRAQ